jgi:hypothetical protein
MPPHDAGLAPQKNDKSHSSCNFSKSTTRMRMIIVDNVPCSSCTPPKSIVSGVTCLQTQEVTQAIEKKYKTNMNVGSMRQGH